MWCKAIDKEIMWKSNADVNTKSEDSKGKFHYSSITFNEKKMWGTTFCVSLTVKQQKKKQ
jgi:hypothetical protein